MKTILVTGSSGLIGSQACRFFANKGFKVLGIDNDMRSYFFGSEASTISNKKKLEEDLGEYIKSFDVDIRDYSTLERIYKDYHPELVIHAAAQPSHDWASKEPLTDFAINAQGTLNLLELTRLHSPLSPFIFTSTNKVYGDTPNKLPLVELETRFEIEPTHKYAEQGIDESMSIDNSTHSVFGASKVAADIMVQEYGRYFGLKTVVFRGGCLTGPEHNGAELHGFLAYLAKCIAKGKDYSIFGYLGKQVRDNIHSYDLVNMFWHFYQNPKSGSIYNAGGSRFSNISMREAIVKLEKILGKKGRINYQETNRIGDHIWYVSDVSKFKNDYPDWEYTYDIDKILEEICIYGKF